MSYIVIDDEPHAIDELCELIAHVPHLNLVESFPDARQAIAYLQKGDKYKSVFLDFLKKHTLKS